MNEKPSDICPHFCWCGFYCGLPDNHDGPDLCWEHYVDEVLTPYLNSPPTA